MKPFLSLLLAVMATPCLASDWWYVTMSSDNDAFFVDVSTIVISSGVVSYWQDIDYGTPKNGVSSEKQRRSVTCYTNPRKISLLDYVEYRPDGSVNNLDTIRTPTFTVLAPDTVGDTTAKFVCSSLAERNKIGTKVTIDLSRFAKGMRLLPQVPQ